MRTLPTTMVQALAPFALLFSERVWQHALVVLAGTILAPGRRTVSSALRARGLDQEKRFHRYHRVLSRASWSSAANLIDGISSSHFLGDPPDEGCLIQELHNGSLAGGVCPRQYS